MIAVALFLFGAFAPAAVQVRNFGIVNEHVYRGAAPTASQLPDLQHAGVKLIIDLREHSQATESEKATVEALEMRYVNIPLPSFSAPPAASVNEVLALLRQNSEQTVFLHCRRGKDRTGTIVACYRIAHDGWDSARALREANDYGMSTGERGMRLFIRHFMPELSIQ